MSTIVKDISIHQRRRKEVVLVPPTSMMDGGTESLPTALLLCSAFHILLCVCVIVAYQNEMKMNGRHIRAAWCLLWTGRANLITIGSTVHRPSSFHVVI